MSVADKYELQRRLVQKSVPELHAIFSDQASRQDMGIPFGSWVANSRNPTAFMDALKGNSPEAQ